MTTPSADPHRECRVLRSGVPLAEARAAVILIHGRGSSADDILQLGRHFPEGPVACLAPQAAGSEWYPGRFLAPLAANEPHLSSALGLMRRLIDEVVAAGVPRTRILVGGFSQGACLSLETAARLGGRFGGIFALSGALIGPPGAPRPLDRRLDGTPVFHGCGDVDVHIPVASVQESTRVLTALGAAVTERIYRGLGHVIVSDETAHIRAQIRHVLDS